MINKLISLTLPYMPKKLVWVFSKKYIAGETIEQAIEKSKKLNKQGCCVTVDLLGEFIKNLDEARENRDAYLEIIEKFEAAGVDGNFSVKPTFFGLLFDKEQCYQYIRDVVVKAAQYNNFIRIDMEDSPCVDAEIEIYRRIHKEFPKNVGLVVQAYLKRTLQDVKNMMDMNNGEVTTNYRLCKGIYVEPAEIAYKKYQEINDHFVEDLDFMLENNVYVGIATHDKKLVEAAYELIDKHQSAKDRYEFQMLYGVTPELRKSVVAKGHKMRIYIPFGKDWFGYSTRRLKENPKMAWHIIKALFTRG